MEYKPKYKRKNTKMFDPLKRYEVPLHKILDLEIPVNLDRLSKHKSNIERYQQNEFWEKLNTEQINASHTVKQLRSVLTELDSLKSMIDPSALEAFNERTKETKQEALTAVDSFLADYDNVMSPLKGLCEDRLKDDDDVACSGPPQIQMLLNENKEAEMQCVQKLEEENATLYNNYKSYSKLTWELQELSTLMHKFAQYVRQQDEPIQRIEDNVEYANENVNQGTKELSKALLYKMGAIPLTGAICGGIIGGPIGIYFGLKIAAAASVGGSMIGYFGGKVLQKKAVSDAGIVEMKEINSSDSFDKKST